jgi:hypothetical protein
MPYKLFFAQLGEKKKLWRRDEKSGPFFKEKSS